MTNEQLEHYRNLIKNPSEEYMRKAVKSITDEAIGRLNPQKPMTKTERMRRYRTKMKKDLTKFEDF